jgi:hypothetical protein
MVPTGTGSNDMHDAHELEGLLMSSGLDYESHDGGTWVVHDGGDHLDNIVIQLSPPVIVFRVKLMAPPRDLAQRAQLYERLLQLNATDMVAGAYALEGDAVVITETLQTENLDANELQAAVDGLSLAISEHYQELRGYLSA